MKTTADKSTVYLVIQTIIEAQRTVEVIKTIEK
jgi:hypothetical protein